jgi:hypothetical protein
VGVAAVTRKVITEEVMLKVFDETNDDTVDGWCDADRVHAYFIAAQGWAT